MSKIAKTTFCLMLATVIGKILGFGREVVLASTYGISMYSDAYLTAMNIPLVIFASIGSALATTFIPMFYEIKENNGEKEALKFTSNIINIVIILSLILLFIGLIFTDSLVKVFAIGFKEESFKIAVSFTRIMMIGIVFTGISFIMTSYLQIKNNFIIPGIISVPKNVIIIMGILLSIKYGPYTMVWGTVIAMFSEFIFQLPFAIKSGFRYSLYVDLKDESIKKVMYLIGPVLIGVGANQINAMIDRTLASTLVEGSISALNYASKLNSFVMALFIVSISTVVYPMLSKLSAEENKDKFIQSVITSVNSVILLVMPIATGAIVLAVPIVKVLFERGEFDHAATGMTAVALAMYSIGMVSFGLTDILGKVFYSLKETKTPMINSCISMGLNIIFNIILIKKMQHAGLALGTSLATTISIFLLFRSLKNKIGYFGQDKIIKTTIKSMISAIIMGVITNTAYNKLPIIIPGDGFINEFVILVVSIIIGAISYFGLIILLRVDEANIIINTFKKVCKNFYSKINVKQA